MTADGNSDESPGTQDAREHTEEMIDEASEETFPASDPPSGWSGPDQEQP
jgi:hypothetical protein